MPKKNVRLVKKTISTRYLSFIRFHKFVRRIKVDPSSCNLPKELIKQVYTRWICAQGAYTHSLIHNTWVIPDKVDELMRNIRCRKHLQIKFNETELQWCENVICNFMNRNSIDFIPVSVYKHLKVPNLPFNIISHHFMGMKHVYFVCWIYTHTTEI